MLRAFRVVLLLLLASSLLSISDALAQRQQLVFPGQTLGKSVVHSILSDNCHFEITYETSEDTQIPLGKIAPSIVFDSLDVEAMTVDSVLFKTAIQLLHTGIIGITSEWQYQHIANVHYLLHKALELNTTASLTDDILFALGRVITYYNDLGPNHAEFEARLDSARVYYHRILDEEMDQTIHPYLQHAYKLGTGFTYHPKTTGEAAAYFIFNSWNLNNPGGNYDSLLTAGWEYVNRYPVAGYADYLKAYLLDIQSATSSVVDLGDWNISTDEFVDSLRQMQATTDRTVMSYLYTAAINKYANQTRYDEIAAMASDIASAYSADDYLMEISSQKPAYPDFPDMSYALAWNMDVIPVWLGQDETSAPITDSERAMADTCLAIIEDILGSYGIQFQKVESKDDAEMKIMFVDQLGTPGVAQVNVTNYIHNSNARIQIARGRDSTAIVKTTLHEIMHGMGMSGHSWNSEDLLFVSTSNMTGPGMETLHLSARDTLTLQKMYQAPTPWDITEQINAGRTQVLEIPVSAPNGVSDIDSVFANLELWGGSNRELFYNDGSHGDVTAGDTVFSLYFNFAGHHVPWLQNTQISIGVKDKTNLSRAVPFQVFVEEKILVAPSIILVEDFPYSVTLDEGETHSYTFQAMEYYGDPFVYSLSTQSGENLPTGLVLDENSGELSWQPDFSQEGSYSFTLRCHNVLDMNQYSEMSFRIDVTNVPQPPAISQYLANVSLAEDDTAVTIANLSDHFLLVEGSTLSYTIGSGDSYVAIQNDSTLITNLPDDYYGTVDIIIQATSDLQASVQDTFTLQVSPVADAPSFMTSSLQRAFAEFPFVDTLQVAEPDSHDVLQYVLLQAPDWLTVDSSGVLGGTPDSADVDSSSSVIIRVDDGTGLADTLNTELSVEKPAQLSASSTGIDFGNVEVGQVKSAPLVISNSGVLPLTITAISATPSAYSLASAVSVPLVLASGEVLELSLQYSPVSSGTVNGTLKIDIGTPHSFTVVINLDGTGIIAGEMGLQYVESVLDEAGGITSLDESWDVAVSPDGLHVYATAKNDNALTAFSRSTTDGTLTLVDAYVDGTGDIDGLGGASHVAISHDGKFVYASSALDNQVSVFARDAGTGELTLVESAPGMYESTKIVISPDDAHVYLVDTWAVIIYQRDVATGELSLIEQFNVKSQGLVDAATDIAFSPDGVHLYMVTGEFSDKLAVYQRDAATGLLTFVQLLRDDVSGVDGLAGPTGVCVSADGQQVYVSSSSDFSVTQFNRDAATGELTYTAQLKSGEGDVPEYSRFIDLAISSGGGYVYGITNSSVLMLRRDFDSGALTCVDVLTDGLGNPATYEVMLANTVMESPDSRNVYITIRGGNGPGGVVVYQLQPKSAAVNTAPVAVWAGADSVLVGQAFVFDGRLTTDAEDSLAVLEFRWDWNNDGVWDTEYSTEYVTYYAEQFSLNPGIITVTLEARDSGGMSHTYSGTVIVYTETPVMNLVTIDLSGNGEIDIWDVAEIAEYFGQPASAAPACDLNGNGEIDIWDVAVIAEYFGQSVQ
jgi:6-phosphogluconolactonase (cycloisomerase 2 family)